MQDEDAPAPDAGRRWAPWALVAAAAAAALWLAARPLDDWIPEPRPRRALLPEPPPAPAPPPAVVSEPEPAPAPPVAPGAATAAVEPPATAATTEWFAEPGESDEPPSAQEALRDRLQRQLAMNDLAGVRVEIVGDRVVTSGVVPLASDRQRVALIVRSLAPDLVHEDHAEVLGGR
jgi:hypothetical protein